MQMGLDRCKRRWCYELSMSPVGNGGVKHFAEESLHHPESHNCCNTGLSVNEMLQHVFNQPQSEEVQAKNCQGNELSMTLCARSVSAVARWYSSDQKHSKSCQGPLSDSQGLATRFCLGTA